MRISDLIAQYIIDMLEEDDSTDSSATIKRNELAEEIGCVPSQINYVITSRFTPEHGYIVESRRGGGGYIKITRISMDKASAIKHLMETIGTSIDCKRAQDIAAELLARGLIDAKSAKLLYAAVSEQAYRVIEPEKRDIVRAAVLKNMLLAIS